MVDLSWTPTGIWTLFTTQFPQFEIFCDQIFSHVEYIYIYINTSWSQSRNMFIMLIQAQVYIITLTLSHEYFRNRKQETNYHILSVGQESLRIMHNDILYAHRAFPREYCQFGQTTSSCCYKIIILFSLQRITFPCKTHV